MDLEDELTRLFQDERLDVRVAPNAEQAVVAGARRVRRRRIALISAAGVLGALAVAGGTIVLARGPATTDSAVPPPPLPITSSVTSTSPEPSAATTGSTLEDPPPTMTPAAPTAPTTSRTSTTISPPRIAPAQIATTVLGPTGYGPLRLGMTEDQLVATGQVTPVREASPGTCTQYTINGQTGSRLAVSATRGLVLIDPATRIHTPEGISEGATVEQVKAKYPDYDSQASPSVVKVPGNSAAWFSIYPGTGTTIGQIVLIGSQTEC